jgi:hypothetical protein
MKDHPLFQYGRGLGIDRSLRKPGESKAYLKEGFETFGQTQTAESQPWFLLSRNPRSPLALTWIVRERPGSHLCSGA